jgi:MFS superfamily sulfate permease-like transporter
MRCGCHVSYRRLLVLFCFVLSHCTICSPVRDLISGAIMAATSVPQLIAYAETVGYAGYKGLATAGPPLLAWGVVTGSPYMNAGVTSITALMAKSDLDGESYVQEYGEDKYVTLVAAYSMYVGLASVLLAVVGFGRLASLVPKPVRTGFKWGCSFGVLVSALPNGLLAKGSGELKKLVASSALWGELVTQLKARVPAATGAVNVAGFFYAVMNPWDWCLVPTVMFVVGTWFVMEGKSYMPKFFPPGTEVIIVTGAATLYSMYYEYPGGIVGEIPALDPDAGIQVFGMSLPVNLLDYKDILNAPVAERMGGWPMLFVTATLFAAVNFLSIMGIASGFETENDIPWSPPRELISQGVACGVAAMVGSAPVSGSMSRSLVSRMTGTTSQLACILTALIWITMLPYMNIMAPTPKAILSSVIVSAVIKGITNPKDLINATGIDFYIGWATGIATAVTSPTIGFAGGLILYFVVFPLRSKKDKKD